MRSQTITLKEYDEVVVQATTADGITLRFTLDFINDRLYATAETGETITLTNTQTRVYE